MLATRTTFRCGRDCRVRRGAASSAPVRADGGQALHGARGFTLLEMLVVLVIAGLLVSLASLSLTRNPRTDLREEAQVRSRPIAWQPTAHGFRFDVSSPDGWRTPRDGLMRPRDWDGGVTGADIDYPGSDMHANRVVFGTESIDTPVRVTLHSAVGSATIVSTGNGSYEVQ
ncbi:type II secretion system protein GspH [Burkholderia ubonensis]|uniref:prepilin-type N-terminal cleavage/methylation domain-containing protein n=1 Tax=Burkholderia ubonensis TaxID=101571 RepID=UPI0007569478|nr:prepilin-type N-terminal cleavage/methylation domain-containing protein [Burkholderia ubonensis]KVC87077.1 type II secretion system protein GspH [Burkholderia ubonensis]KVZ37885.1 type II secretion system protein GspH [Burkholderia ubonensis]KWB33241.1 type II secretion system protein GspH [Burkholderia ubonensis]KWC34504.1 type II secretion system protein GspH [Burkholderia ubonensis]OJA80222.1 type II secretion system protein GspH [Burkholderia ubonensis]